MQLVLQLLDNKSRLATGRCSRMMLDEMINPFSWKYAETIELDRRNLQVLSRLYPTPSVVAHSLLQLAPIHLDNLKWISLCW